jgi:hypothetical protein
MHAEEILIKLDQDVLAVTPNGPHGASGQGGCKQALLFAEDSRRSG